MQNKGWIFSRSEWRRASVFLLLVGFGYALYGEPAMPPDFFASKYSVLGAFSIFLAFAFGLYGVGYSVASRVLSSAKLSQLLAFPMGAALAVFWVTTIGFLGWIAFPARVASLALLFLGVLWMPEKPKLRVFLVRVLKRNWIYRMIWGAIALEFFLVAALSFRLYPFWDPLWYHLVTSRVWYEQGGISIYSHSLIENIAGAWDSLYFFGPILLGAPKGGGLPVCQLFGQWCHSMLAAGFVLPILFQFFRFLSRDRHVRALAVFSAMGVPVIFFTTVLAKNDWGVVLWAFGGAFLAYYSIEKKSIAKKDLAALGLISGIFLGLAFSTKWSLLFLLLPLGVQWLWVFRKKKYFTKRAPQLCAYSGLGFLGGALPDCLPKFIAMGNPFFPTSSRFFNNSGLGPTWIHNLATLEGGFGTAFGFSLARVRANFMEFSEQNIFYYFFLLCPLLYFYVPKSRKYFSFWLAVSGMIVFFILNSGMNALPRWLASGVLLMGAVLLSAVRDFLLQFSPKLSYFSWKKTVWITMFLILAVESPLIFSARGVASMRNDPPIRDQVLLQPQGHAVDWVRRHLAAKERVLFLAETRVYYVSDLDFTRAWDDADLDREIVEAREPLRIAEIFSKRGYRYMIDTNEFIDQYQNEHLIRAIRLSYQSAEGAVVFSNERSRVIDIQAWLEKASAK